MLSLPQEGQKVLGLNLNRSESNARAIGPNDSILQAAASLLHCGISAHSMSALGQKRTSPVHQAMSALPPKADIARLSLYRAAMTATPAPPIARAAQELVQRNFEAP